MPVSGLVALALAVGIAATVEDLARRQISNWTCLAAFVGGLALQTWQGGWQALGSSFLAAVLAFFAFLVFYLFGGRGAGDVKLMAGFGAILGTGRLLDALILVSIIGALWAVSALAWHAVKSRWRGASRAPLAIPYAPAITLGSWLALVPKH